MSFQPPAPGGSWPTGGASATPPTVAAPTVAASTITGPTPRAAGPRRIPLIVVGLLVAIAGVVAGVLVMGGADTDGAIRQLGRAPVGCVLEFTADKTGSYNVYLEYRGSLPEDRAYRNCTASDTYESSGEVDEPEITVTVEGETLDLDEASGEHYSGAGYAGERIYTVDLERGEDYEVAVSSDQRRADRQYVVALGWGANSPAKVKSSGTTPGLALLIGGLVVGAALVLLGLRRRPVAAPVATAPSPSGAAAAPAWPASTPGAAPAPWSNTPAPYPTPGAPVAQPPAPSTGVAAPPTAAPAAPLPGPSVWPPAAPPSPEPPSAEPPSAEPPNPFDAPPPGR